MQKHYHGVLWRAIWNYPISSHAANDCIFDGDAVGWMHHEICDAVCAFPKAYKGINFLR